ISTSPLPAVPGPQPPPAPPVATPSTPAPAWAPLPSPSPETPGTSTTSRARRSLGDWETLIGGQWALWIGSLAIFLSVAFFLAYAAAALPPPPPIVRVWLGAAAGAAFLATGAWARRRAQAWFGEGLSGAGVAIWYVSIWAAAQYFEPPLLRFAPAF